MSIKNTVFLIAACALLSGALNGMDPQGPALPNCEGLELPGGAWHSQLANGTFSDSDDDIENDPTAAFAQLQLQSPVQSAAKKEAKESKQKEITKPSVAQKLVKKLARSKRKYELGRKEKSLRMAKKKKSNAAESHYSMTATPAPSQGEGYLMGLIRSVGLDKFI